MSKISLGEILKKENVVIKEKNFNIIENSRIKLDNVCDFNNCISKRKYDLEDIETDYEDSCLSFAICKNGEVIFDDATDKEVDEYLAKLVKKHYV